MSDRHRHERALRERVEARHGPLREQEVPTTADEVDELTKTDPDRFNALWEAGLLTPAVESKEER